MAHPDAIEGLDDGANADSVLQSASQGGSTPNADAARASLSPSGSASPEATVSDVEISSAPKATDRMTKKELRDHLEKVEAENAALKQTAKVATPDAVDRLGAMLAAAFQISGKMMASTRGDHWLFPDEEAEPLGEAWAVAVAPYSESIQQYVPWGFAAMLTWKSVDSRLTEDRRLRIARERGNEERKTD